jgi:hypothetical protein
MALHHSMDLAARGAANTYLGSQRAAERVMAGIEQFLAKRLKIKVNTKSAVASLRVRTFLGFLASGWVRLHVGDPETAMAHFTQAIRLSPLDRMMASMLTGISCAHLYVGRIDEAVSWAEAALCEKPNWFRPCRMRLPAMPLPATCRVRASCWLACARSIANSASPISGFFSPVARTQDIARLQERLRLAGLPE